MEAVLVLGMRAEEGILFSEKRSTPLQVFNVNVCSLSSSLEFKIRLHFTRHVLINDFEAGGHGRFREPVRKRKATRYRFRSTERQKQVPRLRFPRIRGANMGPRTRSALMTPDLGRSG